MSWPFDTAEQKAEYDRLKESGYAMLRLAHELFMAAIARRGRLA